MFSQRASLLILLSFSTFVAPAVGAAGDVIAASDFRSGTQDWSLQGTKKGWSSEGLQSEGDVIAAIDDPSMTDKNWYYAAPKSFLGGDKTLAYNGWLVFDLGHFEYESMGMGIMDGYDVYLMAKNKKMSLGLKGVFNLDDNRLSKTYNIRLEETFSPENSETYWEMVNVLKPVDGKLVAKAPTQHEFVTCLQTLTGIWIRGSFFKGSEATWLKNVKILEGAINKGGINGENRTLVNGTLTNFPRITPPTASSECCSSRTCVSNDKYEIIFDRPGCMQSSDMYCCMSGSSMSGDTCDTYSRSFEKSKAAEIVQGTDYNEGRAFFLPGQVDRCSGAGTGQYGSKFSKCFDGGSADQPAAWDTATKNQNMGLMAVPIRKPFIKDYYMGSVPRICSAATLTVEAHGDLSDPTDSIMVYGEDDEYLGTLFAGNLTYMTEGQRAYDPYGPGTECDGLYDSAIPGTDTNARLNDPHHPSGNRPRMNGYRGGREDVVTAGVFGQENTKCKPWASSRYGKQPLSLEHSEATPYKDSIAISQDKMMMYSADEQIKFTFRSVRDDSVQNTFSGTGGGGATSFCAYASGNTSCGTVACEGCDLDGKVIFRSIRLRFSAGTCYVKKLATDFRHEYLTQVHGPQPLNISVKYTVPVGANGAPGGDAALSLTVGADIFGLDKFISVYDANLNKIGDLFRRESVHTLRSHMTDDIMVTTNSFGAVDAPTPFYPTTNCDTTNPITRTDKCTPADNQWSMGPTVVNYTDTILIPRSKVASMAVNGQVQLYLAADVPANAFSLSAEGNARFSPITLAYPLMHCFMKSIKKGPNFGIFLERPQSYYFKESGFPMPGGDVTLFIVAHWQKHVRYVQRHVGQAISDKWAYDGVEDGLPVMRVDKDTVADLGTRWIFKNKDGSECCPETSRPAVAVGDHVVAAYSNCLMDGCVDPNADTTDSCTETDPCPKSSAVVSGGDMSTGNYDIWVSTTSGPFQSAARDHVFVGMKVYLSSPLDTNVVPQAVSAGTGCSAGTYRLRISGGGGTGVLATYTHSGSAVTAVTMNSGGAGFYDNTAVTAVAVGSSDGNRHGCEVLPTFNFTGAVLAYSTGITQANLPYYVRAYRYDSANNRGVITVDRSLSGTTNPETGTNIRISADGVSSFARNGKDGGTSSGSVAVQLDSTLPCQTGNFLAGYVDAYSQPDRSLRLDSSASLANDAYNEFSIKVKRDGGSYDSPSITDYIGTSMGTAQCGICGSNSITLETSAIASANFYLGATIVVDIDGNDQTGDDIYSAEITGYTAARVAYVGSGDVFGKNVTSSSTYTLYERRVVIDRDLTKVVHNSQNVSYDSQSALALGGDAAIGDYTISLNSAAESTTNEYRGMTIILTSGSVVQQRKIIYYAGGTSRTATLSAPLTHNVSVSGTTYEIFRGFEIYKDLGSECLTNVNMKVTYSIGTAKTVSNDPGELLEIYSTWDQPNGRATAASPNRVKAWVLKLAGDGYYEDNVYGAEGVGAFVSTSLRFALAASDTEINVTSTAGIVPGQFYRITDQQLANQREEIVYVRAVTTTTGLSVTRAQKFTQAVSHPSGSIIVGPVGNTGQGYDEMATLGGVNRPSSTTDDAYKNLTVTIISGKGVGQSRNIESYHGRSRTAYVSEPWTIVPDETTRYRIHATAEIQEFDTTTFIAIVTFPRPVKKGYLYTMDWYDCASEPHRAVGTAGIANNALMGLPMCTGKLGVRVPKQGAPIVYRRFTVLQTRYVAGSITSVASAGRITLDDNAETTTNLYVGRMITLSTTIPTGSIPIRLSGSGCTASSGTLIFNGGGGTGAVGTYTASGGSITGATLTNGGSFYTSYPSVTVSDNNCMNYAFNWDNVTIQDIVSPAIGEIRMITAYTSGREALVNPDFSRVVNTGFQYRIDPALGESSQTTISAGANWETYTAYEVDVIRDEYPEMVAQHKEWPHGYSYLKLLAGEDGEHIANLFLKDYTQYSTNSYYTDTVTIPKSVFETYVSRTGEFPFTIKSPPGKGNIELLSMVFGYPVVNAADATTVLDETEVPTERFATHGPPPFFQHTPAWSGADEDNRVSATHPRFQTHRYTSTCGNGMHDEGEYCDDGNNNDGDGCSSSCRLETGWMCETVSLDKPSICTLGKIGERLPDQEVGCKYYGCQSTNTAYLLTGTKCSGTTKDTNGNYAICLDSNSVQGTCDLCVTWDLSAAGLPEDSGIKGFAGATMRR